MIPGMRVDLLCNKLVLVTLKGSGTAVTGFADLASAKSIALADGSVPAGKYARQVLINLGILDGSKAAADYTTAEVSAALGGVEINECSSVSKVKEAVKEGSNEVGLVYYSDAYSIKDDVDILETADSSLTGNIIYPVCRVNNAEATAAETAAAEDFVAFLRRMRRRLSSKNSCLSFTNKRPSATFVMHGAPPQTALHVPAVMRFGGGHFFYSIPEPNRGDKTARLFGKYDMMNASRIRGESHGATHRNTAVAGLQPALDLAQNGRGRNRAVLFSGHLAARGVMRMGKRAKAVVDGLLTLPMVLPPTVAGFFLLLIFSLRRPIGTFLYATFSIKVVQSWLGCILAASVIALPLMYRNARAAFEQVDIELIYAARTLGMSERKIFWRVALPSAGPGVVSGTILTFARALGEYGATSMLAGNIAGKTGTISQRIAMVIQNGDYLTAAFGLS